MNQSDLCLAKLWPEIDTGERTFGDITHRTFTLNPYRVRGASSAWYASVLGSSRAYTPAHNGCSPTSGAYADATWVGRGWGPGQLRGGDSRRLATLDKAAVAGVGEGKGDSGSRAVLGGLSPVGWQAASSSTTRMIESTRACRLSITLTFTSELPAPFRWAASFVTIPTVDLLAEFFRHNTMMNEHLLETCMPLTAEQLEATAKGTYGSIGATLVHISNAQEGYAARVLGTERPERLPEDPFPGFEALSERFAAGNAKLEQAIGHVDRDREVVVGGDDEEAWRLPASLILIQAINHGTEHRSQISTILTHIGIEPPEMDGWNFFVESGQMVRA